MCIATGGKMMTPLSAQDVCFCASLFGCQGGMIRTPWTHILHAGAVTGGQYKGTGPFGAGMCADYSLPHCHHHGPQVIGQAARVGALGASALPSPTMPPRPPALYRGSLALHPCVLLLSMPPSTPSPEQGDDPFPPEGAAGCPSESSPRCPRTCDADAGASHADWAADKISFIGAIQSASGEAAIQQMIMAGGPVETAFTVYSDFEDYAGGIYHHVKGAPAARAREGGDGEGVSRVSLKWGREEGSERGWGWSGVVMVSLFSLTAHPAHSAHPPMLSVNRQLGWRPRRQVRWLGRRQRHQILEGRKQLEPALGRGRLFPDRARGQRGRHRVAGDCRRRRGKVGPQAGARRDARLRHARGRLCLSRDGETPRRRQEGGAGGRALSRMTSGFTGRSTHLGRLEPRE